MTRKDYQLIADAFTAARKDVFTTELDASRADTLDGISLAAGWVADALARDDPRFDRVKFLTACGA